MSAVAGALVLLALCAMGGVSFFVDAAMLDYAPRLVADLLLTPSLALLASAALLGLSLRRRGLADYVLAAVLFAAAFFLEERMFRDYADPLASSVMMGQWRGEPFSLAKTLAWAAGLYYALRLARLGERSAAAAAAAAAVAGAVVFGVAAGPRINRFGLASFPPNTVIVDDSAFMREARDFPTVTNRYNSLGYRDVEPGPPDARRARVLLVGNAFVGGRGIASNDDTLAAHLRGELEAARPGRYDVVSAAFPSYSLYGDCRAVKALAAELKPKIAVVAYSYLYDQAPFDAQAIMDHGPKNPVLDRVLSVLRLRAYVHVTARRRFDRDDPQALARLMVCAQALVEDLERFTSGRGIELVVLHSSFHEPPQRQQRFSPEVRHLWLPDELGFRPGSPYWYADDGHPRPEFNRRAAKDLAALIVRGPARPAGRGLPRARAR